VTDRGITGATTCLRLLDGMLNRQLLLCPAFYFRGSKLMRPERPKVEYQAKAGEGFLGRWPLAPSQPVRGSVGVLQAPPAAETFLFNFDCYRKVQRWSGNTADENSP